MRHREDAEARCDFRQECVDALSPATLAPKSLRIGSQPAALVRRWRGRYGDYGVDRNGIGLGGGGPC